MNQLDTDLVVLDAHGVVLNNPLPEFLHRVGERTGEGGAELLLRWRHSIRTAFWSGLIDDADMWELVAPGARPDALRTELEATYTRGPLFDWVVASAPHQRIWILSNHHSAWLHARLERFGLRNRFERVLVSDQIGHPKPCPGAFRPLLDIVEQQPLVFVDDASRNVGAARDLGIRALHVDAARRRDWPLHAR